jgi:SAM-dependent methyltransferase
MKHAEPRTSYDPTYFQPLAEVEDRHFWFRARNRVIATLVHELVFGLRPGYSVLEIGCGTGNVLRALKDACPGGVVVGMDLHQDGLRFARARLPDALLVRGDAAQPPFTNRFAVVGMFDVLEHLDDDVAVLGSARSLLAENGRLVITVPAARSLWSYFDEAAQHVRRYERRELAEKLRRSGFEVEFLSYYMMPLYPVLWVGRRIASRQAPSRGDSSERNRELVNQELHVNPMASAMLGPLLALELPWLRGRRRLPFGSSIVAVARSKVC